MKKVITLLLALALVLGMVACSSNTDTTTDTSTDTSTDTTTDTGSDTADTGDTSSDGSFDGTIKVAVAGPMTGDNAEYGIGFGNAADLMAAEWNANGGVTVGDKTYEVVIEKFDDKSESDEATTIAYNIVSDPDIYGVIGHFASGICMVSAPIYNEAQYINISPTSSHADYSSIGDYIFRNNTVINVETRTGAEIAINDLGGTNIGVLSIDTEWGQSAGNAMEENIKDLGANVALRQEVSETAVDFATEIANFREAGADVIMVAGMYGTYGPFIVAMQKQRLHRSHRWLLQRLHRSDARVCQPGSRHPGLCACLLLRRQPRRGCAGLCGGLHQRLRRRSLRSDHPGLRLRRHPAGGH